jgi:hypothetical protein
MVATGAVALAASGILGAGTAGATPAGTPQSLNACMGYITAYGDHPEMSPAFFAEWDGVSVQTLMEWTREYCGTGNH